MTSLALARRSKISVSVIKGKAWRRSMCGPRPEQACNGSNEQLCGRVMLVITFLDNAAGSGFDAAAGMSQN